MLKAMLSFTRKCRVTVNRVRFGAFEVDQQARELRKHGVRIKIEGQPFEVLTALLEKPGQVVTRSELRQRLWPEGTFVDFEKSLTKAVNRVRTALGDPAATPRFVETLSRRGYRFIAPVSVVEAATPGAPLHPNVEEVSPLNGPAQPDRHWRRWGLALGGFTLAMAAVLLAFNVFDLRVRGFRALAGDHAVPFGIQSIAVLPFQNLSGDPQQEYLADGLTEMLIGDLAKAITLRVISHTSVMRYKADRKPLPEIGRELNVDGIIEGSVLRSGTRVRFTVQLLLARTDMHLWSESYERDFVDTMLLEQQMAEAIAHEVTGRLTPAAEVRLALVRRGTNSRAYDAYLRGRYMLGQRNPQSVTAAIGFFEQALREDPRFAVAYSGLADSYTVGWWDVSPDLVKAEYYARQALALAPDLAEAHASLGIVSGYSCRFAEADEELERAIRLNPNYSMAHHWLGLLRVWFGRFDDALAENERARELDPFSVPINNARTIALFGLHQYDRAMEQARVLAVIDPKNPAGPNWMARIYWIEGRAADAIAEERKAAILTARPLRARDLDEIATVYAKAGLRAAEARSARLAERGFGKGYHAIDVASRYALAGDQRKAIEWLHAAQREKPNDVLFALNTFPEFDFMRSTPEFHDLLRGMRLEQ